MKSPIVVGAALVVGLALAGCGNPVDRVVKSDADRAVLWDRIAASPELTDQLVDRLMAADSTRARVLTRVLGNGPGRQDLLTMVGRDQSLMEGAIHFGVQDPATREHLMTLFRGMQMTTAP